MRRRLGAGIVLAVAGAVAGCSSGTTDVTSAAGSPVAGSGPPAATARAVPGAPECTGFPPPEGAGGLPCLGPGPAVQLSQLPGPIVVSAWASWCKPCREELPVLQQFHEAGGSVLGVDAADIPSSGAALVDELGLTFPSVQDTGSATRLDIGWSGLPANVVIVDGRVAYRFNRPITSVAQVQAAVDQASGKGA